MSHWDSARQLIVRWPDEKIPEYPGWTRIDCGCCAGIKWGGETPRDCTSCGGCGMICRHDATGTLAMYPGGPLLGVDSVIRNAIMAERVRTRAS